SSAHLRPTRLRLGRTLSTRYTRSDMADSTPPSPRAQGSTVGLRGSSKQLTFRRFKLRVTRGKDKGLEIASDGAEVAVGTADGNQLVLSDPSVSRYHCVVTSTDEGFVLRDVGRPKVT